MAFRWIVVLSSLALLLVARFFWMSGPQLLTATELLSEAESALQQSGYDILARIDLPKLTNGGDAEGLLLFSGVDLERALANQNPEQLLDIPVALLAMTSVDGDAKLIPSELPVNIWSIDGATQALNIPPVQWSERISASQLENPRSLDVTPSIPLRVVSTLSYAETLDRIEQIGKTVLGEENMWVVDIGRRIAVSEHEQFKMALLIMLDSALPDSPPQIDSDDSYILNCCHRVLVTEDQEGVVTVLTRPLNSLDNLMATTAQSPTCGRPTVSSSAAAGSTMAVTEMTCPFDAAVWFALQRDSAK